MIYYQLVKNKSDQIYYVNEAWQFIIPVSLSNTDYARFKREIEVGMAELQDADGQPMSVADAKAYVATLP